MNDVAIIGGGHAGQAVGRACIKSGLDVVIIADSMDKPESWSGEWIRGRGVVSGDGVVAVLDEATGDEKRTIRVKAIVLAVGSFDAGKLSGRMLGITKLGAEFTADNNAIISDQKGRTSAKGIYAAGSCASTATPDIVADLVEYCAVSLSS